jgi:hypothetical protein
MASTNRFQRIPWVSPIFSQDPSELMSGNSEMGTGSNPTCVSAVTGAIQYMQQAGSPWIGFLWWAGTHLRSRVAQTLTLVPLVSRSLVGNLHLQHGAPKRCGYPNHAPRSYELPLSAQTRYCFALSNAWLTWPNLGSFCPVNPSY